MLLAVGDEETTAVESRRSASAPAPAASPGRAVVPITRIGGAPAAVRRPAGATGRHRPHRAREAVVHDERAHAGRDLHRLLLQLRGGVDAGRRPGRRGSVTAQNDSSTWSSPPSSVRPTKRVGAREQRRRVALLGVGEGVGEPGHAGAAEVQLLEHRGVEAGLVERAAVGIAGGERCLGRPARAARRTPRLGVAAVVERAPAVVGAVGEEVVERVLEPAGLAERAPRAPTASGRPGPSSTNARTRSGYALRVARAEERAVRVADERQALAPPARSASCSRSRTASAVDTCASRSPLRAAHCCASDGHRGRRARRAPRRSPAGTTGRRADRGCRRTRSGSLSPTPRGSKATRSNRSRTASGNDDAALRRNSTAGYAGAAGVEHERADARDRASRAGARITARSSVGADGRRVERHRRAWRTGTRRRTPSTRATSSAPGPTAPRPPARRASAPPPG